MTQRRSLKVAIEHGISLETQIWEQDLRTEMPVFLCASQARARQFEQETEGRRLALPIGPMLEYAMPERAPRPGRRLLAFPAHSTHHIDANYDGEEFAQRLEAASADFDALTVCVYWKEVLRGLHEPYMQRGFECVTAGHIYDRRFLGRLRTYFDEAGAVITNEVGSHLLFAVARGLPVALVRQSMDYRFDTSQVPGGEIETDPRFRPYRQMQRLFTDQIEEPRGEAVEFVRTMAGAEHLRSAAELRAILAGAEDRFRAAHGTGDRSLLRIKGFAREGQAVLEGLRRKRP